MKCSWFWDFYNFQFFKRDLKKKKGSKDWINFRHVQLHPSIIHKFSITFKKTSTRTLIYLDRQQILKERSKPELTPEHPPFASMERRALVIVATCLPLSLPPYFLLADCRQDEYLLGIQIFPRDLGGDGGGRWSATNVQIFLVGSLL